MDIFPNGSRPTKKAPTSYFTGTVYQDPIVEAQAPATQRSLLVTFEPGARTAWHTHPLGQMLYIVSGSGLVQSQGGPIRAIKAGDCVFFAPGEKHWHGASPTNQMVHVAVAEAKDGQHVNWMEHVTDAEYAKPVG